MTEGPILVLRHAPHPGRKSVAGVWGKRPTRGPLQSAVSNPQFAPAGHPAQASVSEDETVIDLYTWTTPNGRKISIALEEFGLPYTVHPVDIGKDEQFKPEFLKISPNNRIPAIVDRDNGVALMESGAILIYLADKTGKFLPREGEARYRVIEWLMWQMGGPGPMFGQVHHFTKYNPGKAPYAEERYLKEAHRLYGVLDKRLATQRLRRRRLLDRRHGDLAVGVALRVADRRPQQVSQRQALVPGHRRRGRPCRRATRCRRTSARCRSRRDLSTAHSRDPPTLGLSYGGLEVRRSA